MFEHLVQEKTNTDILGFTFQNPIYNLQMGSGK